MTGQRVVAVVGFVKDLARWILGILVDGCFANIIFNDF